MALSREEFERLVDDLLEVGDRVDFFRSVPYKELFVILKDVDSHLLKEGESLFSHGWERGRICLVMSGEVGLYTEDKIIHTPQGIDIKSPPIAILKRGETTGQISAMSPLERAFKTKVVSKEADIISFCVDFSKEKECLRGFLALYKNAFFRLSEGVIKVVNLSKIKGRENDRAIEAYLANIH